MSISKAKNGAKTPAEKILRCLLDPLLLFWSFLVALWFPIVLFHRARRSLFRRKKDPFIAERWTAELPTPDITRELLGRPGSHIVIVGASFGELVIIDKITRGIKGDRPEAKVTWAIRDRPTVELVKRLHAGQSVVFWPYDWIVPVMRWVKNTQPDVLLMVEKFRFPVLAHGAHKFGADVVLVSGRFKKHRLFHILSGPYFKWLFGAYRKMFLQNDQYMGSLKPFVSDSTNAVVTGDIKFDLRHVPIEANKSAEIDRWIDSASSSPILAAASTDGQEEERFVLDAYMAVRKKHDVRLLMAPRKTERVQELTETLESFGLTVSRRSKMEGAADVYLLDTLGELSYAYKFATAAYVGGALVGMGHNVLEPLEWGVPVSYGPRRGHFGPIQESCERAGVGTRIWESSELSAHWMALLESPESDEQLAELCRAMLEQHRGALAVTLKELNELLDERDSLTAWASST
jgi:3-deoxy-D-manno-octulosonic-acid transferase